jgi:hypothetical protein
MPLSPMTPEQIACQCELVCNAADAMEAAGLCEATEDMLEAVVNLDTLEVRVSRKKERANLLYRY